MTTVVDDLLESVTIDICMEKTKNVIVSCNTELPDQTLKYLNIGWKTGLQYHYNFFFSYAYVFFFVCVCLFF